MWQRQSWGSPRQTQPASEHSCGQEFCGSCSRQSEQKEQAAAESYSECGEMQATQTVTAERICSYCEDSRKEEEAAETTGSMEKDAARAKGTKPACCKEHFRSYGGLALGRRKEATITDAAELVANQARAKSQTGRKRRSASLWLTIG